MIDFNPNNFSLLWLDKSLEPEPEYPIQENSNIIKDLELERISLEMSIDNWHKTGVDMILSNLCNDPLNITYRVDIVDDLLNNPSVSDGLESILPMLDELVRISRNNQIKELDFLEAVKRLSELDIYIQIISELQRVLSEAKDGLKSKGLKELLYLINSVANDETFISLQKELPDIKAGIRNISSVTVGINLNSMLYPTEVKLVSINEQPFKEENLFSRISSKLSGENKLPGITPLYKLNKNRSEPLSIGEKNYDAFMKALFTDLERLLKSVIRPLIPMVNKYINISSRFLVDLIPEICYFMGAIKLIKKLQYIGLPMCMPVVSPMDKRICIIEDSYNLILALNMYNKNSEADISNSIVYNNISFDPKSRIFVLTGPNQGGKTTYIQSIGLIQVLFQMGLFVPGTRADISPADKIFTHFPIEECSKSNMGRMGEESERLHHIFCNATSFSLVLLNESLSSTSSAEALFISREVLFGLKVLSIRAIIATHIHELANDLDIINSTIPGDSIIASLVSIVDEEKSDNAITKRTYKIIPGAPIGLSYARDIASKYGISLDKIIDTLQERQVIDDSMKMVDINKVYNSLYHERLL